MSLHPKQELGGLQERDNPSSLLRFHYNPTEWVWNRSVEYEEAEAPGRDAYTLQWKGGKPRQVTLEIFLNDWGEDTNDRQGGNLPVGESLEWLDRATQPAVARDGSEGAPPILLLYGQPSLPVGDWVLTDVHVRTLMCAPVGWGSVKPGAPIRAVANISLSQYVPATI